MWPGESPAAQATGHREIVRVQDSDLRAYILFVLKESLRSLLNVQSQPLVIQEMFIAACSVPGTVLGAGHAAVRRMRISVLEELPF